MRRRIDPKTPDVSRESMRVHLKVNRPVFGVNRQHSEGSESWFRVFPDTVFKRARLETVTCRLISAENFFEGARL
jgi:hypothetical protein